MNDSTVNHPDEWVERLMHDDENVRLTAIREMARLGRPALECALDLVHDPRPRVRAMAASLLGLVGGFDFSLPGQDPIFEVYYPEGIPALLNLLERDPDDHVRASAAGALGNHESAKTLPFLCDAANDPSAEVRYGVAQGLEAFHSGFWENAETGEYRPAVIQTLLALMDDVDDDVRDWATFAVHQGGHDTPATRARLWKALDDSNPDVRGESAEGLAKFNDRTLIPRLEQLLLLDDDISPCYFAAAENLEEPALLPAVLEAAQRWREIMEPGEELHSYIVSAIEALGGEIPSTWHLPEASADPA